MKKAKTDPMAAQIAEVCRALESAADLPASVKGCLSGVIPFSLGVARDVRHKYQVEAVEMIQEAMQSIGRATDQAVKTAEGLKLEASKKVESQSALLEKSQRELAAKKETSNGYKLQLAEVARIFQKTKAAVKDILVQQESGLSDFTTAESTKLKVEALLAQMNTAHDGGEKACAKFLDRVSQHVDIAEIPRAAIVSALAKDAAGRGGFDAMVIGQLSESVEAKIRDLNKTIENAVPMKAALQKDVAGAQQAHTAAKEKQMGAANTFKSADKEVSACSEGIKAGQKELTSFRKQEKKASEALSDAEFNREAFKTGPLDVFTFLRDRETPPPPPAAVEEAAEGAVAVVDAEDIA